jgi:hypothetical protein
MVQLSDGAISILNEARKLNGKPEIDNGDHYSTIHEAFECGLENASIINRDNDTTTIVLHAVCRECRTEWSPLVVYQSAISEDNRLFSSPSPGAEALRKAMEQLDTITQTPAPEATQSE